MGLSFVAAALRERKMIDAIKSLLEFAGNFLVD